MKFAFSGGRDAPDRLYDAISDTIECLEENEVLVGDCRSGVDLMVRKACEYHKIPCTVYAASSETEPRWSGETVKYVSDWDVDGHSAGPKRNRAMVKDADEVICYWNGYSRGTKSAIDAAVDERTNFQVEFF